MEKMHPPRTAGAKDRRWRFIATKSTSVRGQDHYTNKKLRQRWLVVSEGLPRRVALPFRQMCGSNMATVRRSYS